MPKEESAGGTAAALFEKEGDTSLADGFREANRVSELHAHFDRDGDGYLNHSEIRGLQLITSGNDMDKGTYVMVCKSLACDPNRGLCVNALKIVYAAEGTSIDDDYAKVFSKKKKEKKSQPEEDDDVLEVGDGGVDISG